MNVVDHNIPAETSGMPLVIYPPVIGKNKRNPKRGCGVSLQQRRKWLLWQKRICRRVHNDGILGRLRGIYFHVNEEKGLLFVTLEYIAQLEVWLRLSPVPHEAPSLPVIVSNMLTRSPALREAAIVVDELTNVFLEGYDRDFMCAAMLANGAALSVISTLLAEPFFAGGRAAVQLLDELGQWLLPDPEMAQTWQRQKDLLGGLVKVLAKTMSGMCLFQSNAALALVCIMSVLPANECPHMVAYCATELLELLERPLPLSDHGLGRAAALLVIVLVDWHDVDTVMAQVANKAVDIVQDHAGAGMETYAVETGELGEVAGPLQKGYGLFGEAALQAHHTFVLSSSAFSRMLEIIAGTVRQCFLSQVSSTSATPKAKSRGCHCHIMIMELLWCLNVCSHYSRSMAGNLLMAEDSIPTLKLAAQHFFSTDKQWLCSLALLQLVNNLIVWVPSAAAQICQSFGSLLCIALQTSISNPDNANMKRCGLNLAAAFIKTPHQHAPHYAGCVMSDPVVMTGLGFALKTLR